MQKPAAEGDSVSLVVEFLRIQTVEIVQLGVFQNIGMQRGHTVNAEAIMNINMSHVYHIVAVNDGYAFIGIFSAYFVIQDLDDGHQLRYDFIQIMYRPFLQSLCQNGVVGVGTGFFHYLDSVIHGQTLKNKQTDQLRNHHGGVRVVDLDHSILVQIVKVAALCGAFIQNHLGCCADHEVLLVNTQLSSLFITVIRIQEQSQVVGNICFVKTDTLAHDVLIHGIHIKQVQFVRPVVVSGNGDLIHAGLQGEIFKVYRISNVSFCQPAFFCNPGIFCLFLKLLVKFLFEQTEVIIQSDTGTGVSQCCDGIQEAGCQSSQTAVSQRGLLLQLLDTAQVLAILCQQFFDFIVNAQIDHIVRQKLADQELGGNIIDFLFTFFGFFFFCHFLYDL